MFGVYEIYTKELLFYRCCYNSGIKIHRAPLDNINNVCKNDNDNV